MFASGMTDEEKIALEAMKAKEANLKNKLDHQETDLRTAQQLLKDQQEAQKILMEELQLLQDEVIFFPLIGVPVEKSRTKNAYHSDIVRTVSNSCLAYLCHSFSG